MPRLALAALALPLAAVAPLPAQVTPSADLGQVQRHLRAIETMTADFTQTDRNGKQLTGTLTLKRPGKIRFQYQRGVPILIVGDGHALWFIDYSVRQVQRWPINNSPLGVLLDPSRDISGYARVVPTADPHVVSIDARDPKHPEYGRISLIFTRDAAGPAGLVLQGWVALDAQNNRTSIRLSSQRFNVPVTENSFRWNDPRVTQRR
jgi:outer membrane lipoprotein-sorting protein